MWMAKIVTCVLNMHLLYCDVMLNKLETLQHLHRTGFILSNASCSPLYHHFPLLGNEHLLDRMITNANQRAELLYELNQKFNLVHTHDI